MNKELREDLEYLIRTDDKSITPDVRDDIQMTLDYIDKLEKENKSLNNTLVKIIDENIVVRDRLSNAIEYIEEHNIIGTNKEYLPSGIEKCYSLELMEILRGE